MESDFLAKVIGESNVNIYTSFNQSTLHEMLTMETTYDIIYGDFSRIKLLREDNWFILNQTSSKNSYAVLLIVVDNFWKICMEMDNHERYLIKRTVLNYIKSSINKDYTFMATSLVGTDKLVVLLDLSDFKDEKELATIKVANKIQEQIRGSTDYSVTISISSIYSSITELWKGYEESFKLMDQSFFYDENHILTKEVLKREHFDSNSLESLEYKLIQSLAIGEVKDALDNLKRLCSWVPTLSYIKDYNMIKSELTKLYFKIAAFYVDLGVNTESVNNLLTKVVSDTISASKVIQIESSGIIFIESLDKISNAAGSPELQVSFNRICVFVKEFYYRETRIDEIAGMLNISTSYFCRKFKQFYGVTFITYLNDIRLREARELLEKTSLSITEISHKVGFTEITYFSRSFKKKFGYAPSHLR